MRPRCLQASARATCSTVAVGTHSDYIHVVDCIIIPLLRTNGPKRLKPVEEETHAHHSGSGWGVLSKKLIPRDHSGSGDEESVVMGIFENIAAIGVGS
jgi:hypothetical protein